ncbi:MAG: DedA family protein [Euryarchaeota archaeon]|jgi:membrane protein YqaA with SNARE-associated domain|nr:DedA family protein [Euryarchaeota archaeon]MBT4925588.1 DedA family protein [Euryarchaeota archaeon]
MSWKDTVLDFFDVFGPASLAVLSFTESIIQPVPPDLLYLPLLYDAMGDIPLVMWLFLVVTLSSVAGSYIGYLIGQKWGRDVLDRFAKPKHVAKLEALTIKYGNLGIFIAAFSPIPYKVFGWVAGMGEMNKKAFLIAGLLGRSLRFGLEAILVGVYGQKALDVMFTFLDNEILIGVVLIVSCAVLWFSWSWWSNLSVEEITNSSE